MEEIRRNLADDPIGYLLVVDEERRPIGWVDPIDLPATGPLARELATPMSPFLEPQTTLKDALSMLLGADVQAGIVIDPDQRVLGSVTVDAITEVMRTKGQRRGPRHDPAGPDESR